MFGGQAISPSARRATRSIALALLFSASALAQLPSPNAFRVRPTQVEFTAARDGATPEAAAVFIASPTAAPAVVEILVDAGANNTLPPDWLRVRPRIITTPARIRLEVTRTDFPAGVRTARLLPRLRAGAQSLPLPEVNIQLRIVQRPAELFIAPESLRLVARDGTPFVEESIRVANRGSGPIDCRSVSATPTVPWLRTVVDPSAGCRVLVRALAQQLEPGPYKGSIRIQTPIGAREVPVAFQVFVPAPRIFLFPLGLQFEARQGNDSPQVRNVTVLNTGEADLPYRVSVVNQDEAPWIRLIDPQGTAARGDAGTVGVGVSPRGLAPGSYHALLSVRGDGAANSPMFSAVVLNVAPSNSEPIAAPSPSGLVFNVEAHTGASAPQLITVFTASDTPVPFQASAQALDTERNWLNIAREGATGAPGSSVAGTTSTGAPARLAVTVNPLGLNAGAFEGQVNTVVLTPAGDLDIRTVNVTMVIRPQGVTVTAAAQPPASRAAQRAVDCSPTSLSLTHTGLVSNFLTRAGWPTPLTVRLVDDCGQAVTNGEVIATFSNNDPPLVLTHLRAGSYSGTWIPRNPSETPVGVRTEARTGSLAAAFDLVGTVNALSSPVVAPDGVLNVFFRNPGAPVSPGMIVEIYGSALAGGQVSAALENGRLPVDVNNVSVLVGGIRAPLYSLSPGQINAQIPFELNPGDQQLLIVRSNRAYSVPAPIAIAARQPGLAALPDGTAIALDQSFQLITPQNPARRGAFLVLYLVGLGATEPPVPSAAIAPSDPLARLVDIPTVTIAGRQANVVFAGLTPGFAGLYQLNLQIPDDVPPGSAEILVTQRGVESNRATLPVQ